MSDFSLGRNLFLRRLHQLTPTESEAWDRLLMADPDARRAFMGRSYVSTLSGLGADVLVLVGWASDRPVFFLPMQRSAGLPGWFGVFEPVGGVMTDYFGVVAEPGVQIDAERLLRATRGRINLCVYSHLDETQARHGLRADEHRVGLRTRLQAGPPGHWEVLRQSDRKLVGDTERRERKLVAEHGVLTFEWRSSKPQEDLAWLIDAKKQQYLRTERKQAPLFDERNERLLQELLALRAPDCQGLLSTLKCGGRMVAAHFGLVCGEVLHVWFPVFDRAYANHSPGRMLFRHMFDAAPGHGVLLFDRGEGDTQAKRDFANESHQFGKGVWAASGPLGQGALLVQRLAWRWGAL